MPAPRALVQGVKLLLSAHIPECQLLCLSGNFLLKAWQSSRICPKSLGPCHPCERTRGAPSRTLAQVAVMVVVVVRVVVTAWASLPL